MKKLYTAVGRMQFKGRNQDMRCPMVLLNNKEYKNSGHPGNDDLVNSELAYPL